MTKEFISTSCKKTPADHLQIPLVKIAIKIRPYDSKIIKCVGQYNGPVKYGTVVNIPF